MDHCLDSLTSSRCQHKLAQTHVPAVHHHSIQQVWAYTSSHNTIPSRKGIKPPPESQKQKIPLQNLSESTLWESKKKISGSAIQQNRPISRISLPVKVTTHDLSILKLRKIKVKPVWIGMLLWNWFLRRYSARVSTLRSHSITNHENILLTGILSHSVVFVFCIAIEIKIKKELNWGSDG